MARARNIKPGFYKNEDLAECSVWARLIFPGLWMLADRDGRLEDRPKRIKGELLPFDSVEMEPLLAELHARKFILRYESGGMKCIQILKFKEHQAPHYSEKPSIIPPPFPENGGIMPPPVAERSENPQGIKRGPQPPDSLNPSSLNPSPSNPDPGAGLSQPPEHPEPVGATRRGTVCALLREKGVDVTPGNPLLLGWVEAGATDAQLVEAVERARQHKPPPQRIPARYLDPIIREVIAGPPAGANGGGKPAEPAWWASERATIAKGESVGCRARPGEDMATYRQRVREAIARQATA